MAALADANTTAPEIMQALQDAARARGVELAVYPIERPERVGPTIDEAKRLGAQALNVLSSPSSTIGAATSTSAPPRYGCPPCTNGPKIRKKAR